MKLVFVVDDEQSFLLAVEMALTSFGLQVMTATSGEDALSMIQDHPPDIILLDIMMPGIGGLETLKALKSHPDYKDIPVILVSGARPLAKQSEYGWAAFLEKPFSTAELMQVMRKWL